jgi:hypothetical protein
MTVHYRPWGPLQWLLPRLPNRSWTFVGVLGTEDRCTAALASTPADAIYERHFLHVRDPAPSPAEAFRARYEEIGGRLRALGVRQEEIRPAELLADIDTIAEEVERILARSTPHLILDITSMPKWWFFPMIRMLMSSGRVETLVATYASARDYGKQLSSDPAPLAPLPTFSEPPDREKNQELIVGIGFAALSLRELYSADADKIRYLFPFPPGPPNFMRNWEFLRVLETEIENRSMEEEDRWYVHMYDCPHVFEAIRNFTRDGARTTALAPFGPKTLSLAMCVFALAASKAGRPPVHVFYTQPRRYELDYSTGIAEVDGVPDVKGYCLVLNGADVYRL